MVVKASTKPWPRQLGSSILRALPPLVKPGRVRPPKVKSSQGRGGMAHGAGDAHRAGRGARIARVRPSQVEHEWCLSARVATQLPKRGSQWAVAPGCKATLPPCVTSGQASQVRSGQVKSGQARPSRVRFAKPKVTKVKSKSAHRNLARQFLYIIIVGAKERSSRTRRLRRLQRAVLFRMPTSPPRRSSRSNARPGDA